MDENKMKMSNEIGIDIDEKLKYIIPIDEFDINFLQLNYIAYKARNNDNVVPLWSLQQNKIDNGHYEFEIVIGSSEYTHQSPDCNPVNESTDVASTDNKNKTNITRKLNTTDEIIDFATYMKIVNVFNESDSVIAVIDADQESVIDNKPHVVKDEGPSIKTDHEKTDKNETGNTDLLVTLHVLSGKKIKVSMNNFHGISISGDGVQCRVCMVMVEDVEDHKMEIQHMKRIASAINNKHCIRKIGPIWNHCILCNEVIENIEFHLKCNTAHTEHLERALKLSKNANVCTTSAENSVKSYLLNNPETTTTVHQPTNNFDQIEEKFVSQKLESHIKKQLLLKDRKIVATGKISVVDNDTSLFSSNENFSFCNVCNRKMLSNQLNPHMEGKSHKAQLTKIKKKVMKKADINSDLPNGSKEKNTKTNKHNSKENSVPDNTVTHNNKEGTNDTNKMHLGLNKSVLTSNKCENEHFCNICNRKMQTDQLKAHIQGKSHKAHLLQMKNKGIKIVAKKFDLQSGSGLKNIKLNQLKPQVNSISKEKEKNVANKDNDVTNVEPNGTGKKHFAFDNVIRVLPSNKCKNAACCMVCHRKMQINQVDAHLNGNRHKAQLLEITNEVATITCDLPSGSGNQNTRTKEYQSEQNSVSDVTDVKKNIIYKDKEERNGETHGIDKKHLAIDNDNSVILSKECEDFAFCKICNIQLHINSLKSHEEGEHHKAMLDNEIKIKENAENTAVKPVSKCEIGNPSTQEKDHLFQKNLTEEGEHHKAMLDNENKIKEIAENTAVKPVFKCETTSYVSTQENFDHLFQKNLTRRIFNCNGDRYDEILFNASMDTFSELRRSSSSPKSKNQQTLNDNIIKVADASNAINDKPNTISNTTNTENNKIYELEHVYSAKYDKEHTYLLNKNTITYNNFYLYCEACQVSMYTGAELVHIKKEHHKKRVTKIASSVVTNKRLIHCDTCNVITYLSNDKIYGCYIEKCCTKAIFYKHCVVFVDFDKLYCCYCSEYLSIREVFPHIVTPKHLYKSQTEHPTPYIICYQMKSCDQERFLDCQICKKCVGKTTFMVLLHLSEDHHRSVYKKLLFDNKIKEYCENMLYCTTCNIIIELQNELSHIDHLNHRQMLELQNEKSHIDHLNHRQMLDKSEQWTSFQKSLIAIGFYLLLFYFFSKIPNANTT